LKWRFKLPYAVWALGSDIWGYGRKPVLKNAVRLTLTQARARFADGFKLKDDVQTLSGLDCAFIPSTRRLSLDTPAKAELAGGRKNYLFIGRYHPAKGPDVLLEAIALLPREVRDKVYFHLFGGGPLESDLLRIIEEKNLSDCVKLNGYIEEQKAVAYLTSCDALIIPSRIESIPVVLSDGLQTDCPLIVSDVGDMGDLMRKYKAGRVVAPESPEELREAILRDFNEGASGFGPGFDELKGVFDLKIAVNALLETVPPLM
jgi:glycosyltransferase involved in cell wall biosynthesis